MTAVNVRKSTSADGVFLAKKKTHTHEKKYEEESLWIITSRKPDKEMRRREKN